MNKLKEILGGWGAPLVSLFVLAGFTAICVLIFFRSVPADSRDLANILFGALATMATNVISYWVRSTRRESEGE